MQEINLNTIKQILSRISKEIYSKKEFSEINNSILKLIDFLIMNLNAGIHPQKSFELASKKPGFSKPVRFCLFKISSLCQKGYSFTESVRLIHEEISLISSHRNLSILLLGLNISFSKGVMGVQMLEKIKQKIEDEIQFKRKFSTITAQMRLQANVIIFSPIVIVFILSLIAPSHILVFFESRFGIFLFIIMIILNLTGYLSLRKIINI